MCPHSRLVLLAMLAVVGCRDEVIHPVPLSTADGGAPAATGTGGASAGEGGASTVSSTSGSGGGPTTGGCADDEICALAEPGHGAVSVTTVGGRVLWTERATDPDLSNGVVMWRDDHAELDAPQLLVGGQHDPAGIRAVGARVYWSNLGLNDGLAGDGTIAWCPVAGSCVPTVAAPDTTAYDFALGDRLYGVELGNGTGTIWACDPDACQPEQILTVPDGMPSSLGLAGGTLVWHEFRGPQLPAIKACEAAACIPRVLYEGTGVGAVTTDGTYAFFAAGGAIGVCPLTDDCTPMLGTITNGWSAIADLAVDADAVYFTNAPMGGGGGVYRCAKLTGCFAGADVIAEGDAVAFSPVEVVVTDTRVVWADINRGVFAAPK